MAVDINTGKEVSLEGLNTNYAIQNKWVMYIPLENALGKKYKNLELNLTRFTIPQMNIGSTSVPYKGYTYEFPTGLINAESREITINYIIDESWNAYRSLYIWAANIGNIVPTTATAIQRSIETGSTAGLAEFDATNLLNCRIWLINNYKKRIIDFIFHDCWIKNFSDLALDYANAQEVQHSFTMAYSFFEIADAEA